jgi:hypothetical protein
MAATADPAADTTMEIPSPGKAVPSKPAAGTITDMHADARDNSRDQAASAQQGENGDAAEADEPPHQVSPECVLHVAMEYSISHLGFNDTFMYGGLGKVVDVFLQCWEGDIALCAPLYRGGWQGCAGWARLACLLPELATSHSLLDEWRLLSPLLGCNARACVLQLVAVTSQCCC